LPPPPDPELVVATDRAVSVPAAVGAAARWEVGTVLTATVRYQKDEMLLKVGDHFFSSRPIPGVSEYSRLSLQVSRDLSGALTLVPLLPLAGAAVARIGGAPPPAGGVGAGAVLSAESAEVVAETTTPLVTTSPRLVGGSPLRNLSARLQLPNSLASWLFGTMGSGGGSAAINAVSAAPPSGAGLAGWMHSLATTLAQSGLFFEAQLRDRQPVPTMDLKRRLLEIIESRREGAAVTGAWAALDDLVGLQSAATAAHRSGGTVFSFLLPAPDGLGGWWITLQQDPAGDALDYAGGDGRQSGNRPWRTRLVGVSLPFGDIDIRIEQVGRAGVGITVLTDTADQQGRWDESRAELARRLQDAGLELARWAVLEPQLDSPPAASPGQLQSIRV